MARKVTLKEIAQEAGLSISAVSLVLNDRPNRVSEKSRERIREIARRKHYVPNQIARSLVTKRSKTLGLIVPNITSWFFSSMARELEVRARECGYVLFIVNSGSECTGNSMDAELFNLMVNRGVDGVFLVPSNELSPAPELIEALKNSPAPYVIVDRDLRSLECDKVRFNSLIGGQLATRHLLELGHRRIACIINPHTNAGPNRKAGYRDALEEAGVPFDESLIFHSDYDISASYEVSKHVIESGATAVFATSDNIALGLMKRLHEEGLSVPHDISVVSFDNSAADVLFEPTLTSIEQDVSVLADYALDMMMGRLHEGEGDLPVAEPRECVLEPKLVVNDSTQRI